jgi:hypothetical protein
MVGEVKENLGTISPSSQYGGGVLSEAKRQNESTPDESIRLNNYDKAVNILQGTQ